MRRLAVILAGGMFCVSASGVSAADKAARSLKDRAAKGPSMSIVAKQRTASPGDLVEVDVYISNITDLNTFQVALEVINGDSGSLALEALKVQKTREDFVFGNNQVISAEHLQGARMGATQMSAAVDVGRRAYLGTYKYRISENASGIFKVQIQMGKESFLRNSLGTAIAFRPGKAATISVGEVEAERVHREKK